MLVKNFMSRKCDLNIEKAVMTGNNVSHSNRKTRRRFLPNIQTFSLLSEALGMPIRFNATPNTIRTVEHNNGIDNYLLNTNSKKLSKKARTLKKKIAEITQTKNQEA